MPEGYESYEDLLQTGSGEFTYAIPFVDLRVVAEDGKEVPADGKAMGEIQVRGTFVTGSYYNRERDERPLAVVVLKPGMTASGEELAAFISPKFARWWLPDKYVFVDTIPRTSNRQVFEACVA